eukprot:12498-Heterococcus_DN1.PRE.2
MHCVTASAQVAPELKLDTTAATSADALHCYCAYCRRPWTYRAEEQYYDSRLLAILRSHRRELRNEAALLTFEHKVCCACHYHCAHYVLAVTLVTLELLYAADGLHILKNRCGQSVAVLHASQ